MEKERECTNMWYVYIFYLAIVQRCQCVGPWGYGFIRRRTFCVKTHKSQHFIHFTFSRVHEFRLNLFISINRCENEETPRRAHLWLFYLNFVCVFLFHTHTIPHHFGKHKIFIEIFRNHLSVCWRNVISLHTRKQPKTIFRFCQFRFGIASAHAFHLHFVLYIAHFAFTTSKLIKSWILSL